MKLLIILSFLIFISLPNLCFSQDKEDRLDKILTEITVLKEGQKAINQRITDVNLRIDDLRDELKSGIGNLRDELKSDIGDLRGLIYVLLAGIITLIGFILWDRRTILAPAVKQIEELSQKEKAVDKVLDNVLAVLKAYAKKESRFKEVMQTAGLL